MRKRLNTLLTPPKALDWSSMAYDAVHPVTTAGRVVTILSSLVGIVFLALPTAILTGAYLSALEERREKREKRAE